MIPRSKGTLRRALPEDALHSLPWEEGEVLVVGSSRLGPVARVFLGSNSTKILRSSPVPVVVIPHGADVALVLGRGVAVLLARELGLLQLGVGGHAALVVVAGQLEHRVVEGVEA